jgi:amino acid transporter
MEAPARRLTLLPLVASTYFLVAGGPYGLEDVVAGYGYAWSLLLLLAIPLAWSFPVALAVGELASAMPETGGYYVWVRRGLGPFWGLQKAWLQLAVTIIDLAPYPALLVAYLAQLWPALEPLHLGSPGWTLAVAMVVACALWNLAGIRAVAVGAEWMGVLTLGPFAVLAVLAVASLPSGGLARAQEALASAPPQAVRNAG